MRKLSNSMKIVLGIFILLLCITSLFNARAVKTASDIEVHFKFNLETKGSVKLPENFQDTLAKVNMLLDMVFSSKEFKDSLYTHSFNDSTFSKMKKPCFKKEINEETHRIDGSNVYENLTSDKNINLDLVIQETLKKTTTQGFSNACRFKITSNDYWMGSDQPLAFRYCRHIAHEFTHIRGYRHDNNVDKPYKWGRSANEDPAYGVGKIVGNILTRWSRAGLIKL